MPSLTILPVEAHSPAWERALAIRLEVFVEEQGCPIEEERDAYDAVARHWLALQGETAVGTARAVAKPDGWKIGRVAVLKSHRGLQIGDRLMREIHARALEEGVLRTYLDAQLHAIPFYARLGYVAEGPEFLDGGILHRRMVWLAEPKHSIG